jgi:hypothetical protein
VVLAPERHGPDGTLDGVVVQFDAAVVEESAQGAASARAYSGWRQPVRRVEAAGAVDLPARASSPR